VRDVAGLLTATCPLRHHEIVAIAFSPIASHGIGTARALQVNELAGAFAGLAMGLNALATAILLPMLWRLFF